MTTTVSRLVDRLPNRGRTRGSVGSPAAAASASACGTRRVVDRRRRHVAAEVADEGRPSSPCREAAAPPCRPGPCDSSALRTTTSTSPTRSAGASVASWSTAGSTWWSSIAGLTGALVVVALGADAVGAGAVEDCRVVALAGVAVSGLLAAPHVERGDHRGDRQDGQQGRDERAAMSRLLRWAPRREPVARVLMAWRESWPDRPSRRQTSMPRRRAERARWRAERRRRRRLTSMGSWARASERSISALRTW